MLKDLKQNLVAYITASNDFSNNYISTRYKWDNYQADEMYLQSSIINVTEIKDTTTLIKSFQVQFLLVAKYEQDYDAAIDSFNNIMEFNIAFDSLNTLMTNILVNIVKDFDTPSPITDSTFYSHIFQYTFTIQKDRS